MDTTNPHHISEERIRLAEENSRYTGELAKLIKIRADYYNEFRDAFKSDLAVKRAWEATDEGVKMSIIKLKIKSIAMTMSSYNTHLRLLENEARNLY